MIDLGCGTGEHSIFIASRGHRTLGVDSAPLAIERAKEKARSRGSKAQFQVADALDLSGLGRRFDTAIDSGLFHTFSDDLRPAYASSVGSVVKRGGRLFVLCFSDREPEGWGGPRRVSEAELRGAFSSGWRVDYVRPATFEIAIRGGRAEALLGGLTRL